MKVVFVSKECPPSPSSNGIGTYVWETGLALGRRGNEVTIIAAADGLTQSSSTQAPGLTVIRLPDEELEVGKRNIAIRTVRAPLSAGMAYRKRVAECLAALIQQGQVDLVEFPGFRGEAVEWCSRKRSVPMVVRMHGVTAGIDCTWKDRISATRRMQKDWERQEFEAADTITVVAHHLASPIASRFGEERVRIVYNSIDTDWWAKEAAASEVCTGRDDILFVGALTKRKGVMTLVKTAEILRTKGWKGRLLLAGRISREFRSFMFLRWGLMGRVPDWIVPLGLSPRMLLAPLYRSAGICCFPSLCEALSYTCLEAMASGGLVVGSFRTGMAEILTETCGFLVPPGDVSGLAVALMSALSMSDVERTRMREAAQQRIRDRFDNSVIIPELLSVYDETISSYRN